MILSFRTDRSGQTVKTLISVFTVCYQHLLHPDQGLHCLLSICNICTQIRVFTVCYPFAPRLGSSLFAINLHHLHADQGLHCLLSICIFLMKYPKVWPLFLILGRLQKFSDVQKRNLWYISTRSQSQHIDLKICLLP